MNLEDCVPTMDAAEQIGISYQLLMARIYKKKIHPDHVVKKGHAVFIHKDGVAKEKARQAKLVRERNANNRDVEESAG